MARPTGMAPEQLRALGRLATVRGIDQFYLAGGSAIAFHLRHRISEDLDLFGRGRRASLRPFVKAAPFMTGCQILDQGEAVLKLKIDDVPIDIVRYPYEPTSPLVAGPRGVAIAGLEDLAAMKLSAIARRGIRRDFWDLFEILSQGMTLTRATQVYRSLFGAEQSDLYHVLRALTYFGDAEREPKFPRGLTQARWSRIRAFFTELTPAALMEMANDLSNDGDGDRPTENARGRRSARPSARPLSGRNDWMIAKDARARRASRKRRNTVSISSFRAPGRHNR